MQCFSGDACRLCAGRAGAAEGVSCSGTALNHIVSGRFHLCCQVGTILVSGFVRTPHEPPQHLVHARQCSQAGSVWCRHTMLAAAQASSWCYYVHLPLRTCLCAAHHRPLMRSRGVILVVHAVARLHSAREGSFCSGTAFNHNVPRPQVSIIAAPV